MICLLQYATLKILKTIAIVIVISYLLKRPVYEATNKINLVNNFLVELCLTGTS